MFLSKSLQLWWLGYLCDPPPVNILSSELQTAFPGQSQGTYMDVFLLLRECAVCVRPFTGGKVHRKPVCGFLLTLPDAFFPLLIWLCILTVLLESILTVSVMLKIYENF